MKYLFLLLPLFPYSQGCEDPYNLFGAGTWSDCWEAPQTFSDDCFDAFPNEPLCVPQCGGVYLEFEVGSTGLATFIIESDLNYDFNDVDGAPQLWVHYYIMIATDCLNPIFYTASCGGETIGDSLLIESSGGGSSMGVSDDYIMTLNLGEGNYIMVIGNVGGGTVQDDIEGCLDVGYFTQGALELLFPIEPLGEEKPVKTLLKITDVLSREIKERPNMVLMYYYTDGTVEKRMIIK